jgi:ABC-type uncharacterized transport system substrate-binding protein
LSPIGGDDVVFLTGRDPVELGFVESLNRPGGNLTGVKLLNEELEAKRLELLRELVPNAAAFAFLINPNNRNHLSRVPTIEAVARAGGQQLIVLGVASEGDWPSRRWPDGALGLVVAPDPFLDSQREILVRLAMNHAIPAIRSRDRGLLLVDGLCFTCGGDRKGSAGSCIMAPALLMYLKPRPLCGGAFF